MTAHSGQTIGLVGAGAMGAALGANWIAGGARVITVVDGRSARTRALVAAASLDVVGSLDELVAADVVVSVVPPAAALTVARNVAAAAARTGHRPVVADLNAISPATLERVARILSPLPLVDGSISGAPPTASRSARVYLSGLDVSALHGPWLDVITLPGGLGSASALKMCTASMYKGSKALVMQALLTARTFGVLDEFLDDVFQAWPDDMPRWPTEIALAAAKAHRYVAEMREIAATQAAAGLPPELFDGAADVFARAAETPLGRRAPESITEISLDDLAEVLDGLDSESTGERPAAVLFDFSGTLFYIESAAQAVLAALGPEFVPQAPRLAELGAINGSTEPGELPPELADLWERRDLSAEAHRAAYSGLSRHAGLSAEQATALYDRGVEPEAWHPYPDTVATLRALHEQHVPVALISNIGWNPRPVLARYGVDVYVDELVLSDEEGVVKPDPEIFRRACARLGVDPRRCVMVGDNPVADAGSEALGIRFVRVPADPARRATGALSRAAGVSL